MCVGTRTKTGWAWVLADSGRVAWLLGGDIEMTTAGLLGTGDCEAPETMHVNVLRKRLSWPSEPPQSRSTGELGRRYKKTRTTDPPSGPGGLCPLECTLQGS